MNTKEKLTRFIGLVDQAETIFNSKADWKLKYDLLFSPYIAGIIEEELHMLPENYEDPDVGYEVDCQAFMMALQRSRDQVKELLVQLGGA